MLTFSLIIQIITGVLLVLFILVHSPKGDGMASIGGASQLFSSPKGAEAGLNKVTAACAVIFIFTSILLGYHIIK